MKLEELAQLLTTLNIPVAYTVFEKPQTAPFIIYLSNGTDSIFADNKVLEESINVDIELYTKHKDLALENRIKALLNNAEIPFDKTENYINTEKIYKINYEVTLL